MVGHCNALRPCYNFVQVPEEPLTLDNLFRKTETKPALYWLPLTEQQAVERIARHEAEAAAKADTAAAVEANGLLPVA